MGEGNPSSTPSPQGRPRWPPWPVLPRGLGGAVPAAPGLRAGHGCATLGWVAALLIGGPAGRQLRARRTASCSRHRIPAPGGRAHLAPAPARGRREPAAQPGGPERPPLPGPAWSGSGVGGWLSASPKLASPRPYFPSKGPTYWGQEWRGCSAAPKEHFHARPTGERGQDLGWRTKRDPTRTFGNVGRSWAPCGPYPRRGGGRGERGPQLL